MVLTDMAVSLKTQGFKDIVLLGDSGGNMKPMQDVAEALNVKWKGTGAAASRRPWLRGSRPSRNTSLAFT